MALRILLVSDDEKLCQRILLELERAGHQLAPLRVDTPAWLELVAGREWDLAISDYQLRRLSGPAALELLREAGSEAPFVLIVPSVAGSTVELALADGVEDCVARDRMDCLAAVVERVLERRRDGTDLYRTAPSPTVG